MAPVYAAKGLDIRGILSFCLRGQILYLPSGEDGV